jgi:hypothetical protein
MESNFMAAPNVSLSASYHPVLQTQDYRSLRASDEAIYNQSAVADLDFFRLYEAEQQLQEVKETGTLDSEIDPDGTVPNPFSVADLDFSWLTEAIEQLQEVYQEVMEAGAVDSEVDLIPYSAYQDAFWLLELLDYYNVPMPDIGWLMDGGIGFEWRSQNIKGIGTMSIYGDNQVVYGASLGIGSKIKGTSELTDLVLPVRFLPMLKDLCSQ